MLSKLEGLPESQRHTLPGRRAQGALKGGANPTLVVCSGDFIGV
jgi:hypothetical protein